MSKRKRRRNPRLDRLEPILRTPSSQPFVPPLWCSEEAEETLRQACLEVYKEEGGYLSILCVYDVCMYVFMYVCLSS